MSHKIKVRVTNIGNRIRDRLGSRFYPNQTKEVEINKRHLVILRAVKDFTVEVISEENENTATENNIKSNVKINNDIVTKEENEEQIDENEVFDYDSLTIDQVLEAIESGQITVEEAIAFEVAGKNRSTLLNKLEVMKDKGNE